jgi:hypothetical protein
MRIRAPSCDVRGECYIYKNAFRYKTEIVSEDPEDKGDEVALKEKHEEQELQQLLRGRNKAEEPFVTMTLATKMMPVWEVMQENSK